jgi:hypothetical protein
MKSRKIQQTHFLDRILIEFSEKMDFYNKKIKQIAIKNHMVEQKNNSR